MAIKSCENCAKQFEGDENQIFCSSVCKQQAYRKRKKEKEDDIFQMKFSLEEYEKVLQTPVGKTLGNNNLLLFCFMRKNLPQDISFEKLVFYLEHNIEEFLFATDLNRNVVNHSYKVFYDRYIAGEFTMLEKYD